MSQLTSCLAIRTQHAVSLQTKPDDDSLTLLFDYRNLELGEKKKCKVILCVCDEKNEMHIHIMRNFDNGAGNNSNIIQKVEFLC